MESSSWIIWLFITIIVLWFLKRGMSLINFILCLTVVIIIWVYLYRLFGWSFLG